MSKVAFKLAGGSGSLRHAMPGGGELALDGASAYETDDPREIAVLDAHPSAERVKSEKESK